MRSQHARPAAVEARVSRLLAAHERSLMRVARHWSFSRDDALDAYQRALEIYVRRLDSLDPATEIAWLKVVVKHEALAIRRQHSEAVPVEDVDLDGRALEAQRPVDELLAARERVTRSAEALRRLKPDEAQALMLKAQGLSYQEIGESLGWTYTKVNRCITEGRARFLKVYAEIEAGVECDRFAPTLAALVGGTATADALARAPPAHPQLRDLQSDGPRPPCHPPRPPRRAVADPRAAGAAPMGRDAVRRPEPGVRRRAHSSAPRRMDTAACRRRSCECEEPRDRGVHARSRPDAAGSGSARRGRRGRRRLPGRGGRDDIVRYAGGRPDRRSRERRLAGPPSEPSEAAQAAGTAQARSARPGLDDGSAGSPDSDGSTARAVAGANR